MRANQKKLESFSIVHWNDEKRGGKKFVVNFSSSRRWRKLLTALCGEWMPNRMGNKEMSLRVSTAHTEHQRERKKAD